MITPEQLEALTELLLEAASTFTFEELNESVSRDLSEGTNFSEKSIKLAQKLARKLLTKK